MISEPTDSDVVNAIRSGNTERVNWAVRLLYRHKGYVTGFVRADGQRDLLRFDDHFVNDLFQDTIETFLRKVWDNEYEVITGIDLRTYLYRISYNKYRNERQKSLRRLERDHAYILEADEPKNAEDILLERERDTIVDQLLGKLDKAGGELIRLFDFEQKSHREIGLLLGISEDAAKMRYYRSRKQLDTILKNYGTAD